MRLISSKDTINFLGQAAPKPWVGRMLCWMIIDGQMDAYFETARIQPSGSAFSILLRHREEAGEFHGPKMDEILWREYDQELADKLVGKTGQETILEEPIVWGGEGDPTTLDSGYILFSSLIDWEKGTIRCDWIPDERELREIWFPNEELMYSEFEHAAYEADFTGLAFELSRIEMLLPTMVSASLKSEARVTNPQTSRVGRPPKWDWEGVLAFVIAQAQTPDGLPTGHGAQSEIERMMAEWFEQETGGSPSTSQLRQRASRVMRLIEKD